MSFEIDVESCPGCLSRMHSYNDESPVYKQYIMRVFMLCDGYNTHYKE